MSRFSGHGTITLGGRVLQDGMAVVATDTDGGTFKAIVGAVNLSDLANPKIKLSHPSRGISTKGSMMCSQWVPFSEKAGVPGTWSWPS